MERQRPAQHGHGAVGYNRNNRCPQQRVGAALLLLLAIFSGLGSPVEAQLDCGRAIPFCSSCTARRVGSVTRLFCNACLTGYGVSTDQRSCWCAPGFSWNATGGACEPCGIGSWCPGGNTGSQGPRIACGTNMTTTTSRARYTLQCVPQPGSGLLSDDLNAAACPVGFYSYGFARKPCLSCPRTFTTAGTGASSRWRCACPPGHRYSDDQAVACGFGFWKAGVDFAVACTPCGIGRTTQTNTASAAADCRLAKRGYRLVKVEGVVQSAAACGTGSWSPGGDVTACTPCPGGTITVFALSDDSSDCIPDAGYGFNSTSGSVFACPVGSYKASLGALPCSSCGTGLLTAGAASTSYAACYILMGWGATVVSYSPILFEAKRCATGTYGVSEDTYGPMMGDYACRKCPQSTTTNDTNPALTPEQQAAVVNAGPTVCLTAPGYGLAAEATLPYMCTVGTFSPGYTRDPCLACPEASQIDAPVRSPWGASRQAYRHKSLESWQIRESRGRTPYISPRSWRAVKLINMISVIVLLRSMMLCRCQAGAPRRSEWRRAQALARDTGRTDQLSQGGGPERKSAPTANFYVLLHAAERPVAAPEVPPVVGAPGTTTPADAPLGVSAPPTPASVPAQPTDVPAPPQDVDMPDAD
ncbi:MAG: hypothetical protein J3K34DRAFT_460421, partial [Monoraphidium minutum]